MKFFLVQAIPWNAITKKEVQDKNFMIASPMKHIVELGIIKTMEQTIEEQ